MNTMLLHKGVTGIEELHLVKLKLEDLDRVMALQEKIVANIEDPQIFVSSTREEFTEVVQSLGCIMGYQTTEGKLVALGAYSTYGYDAHNYGYDLDLEGEALLTIGQIEATIVDPDYRGSGLQRRLCMVLEEVARAEKKQFIAATVSPSNSFSLNNFLKLDYEIKKDKLKYGGLRRYVVCKNL